MFKIAKNYKNFVYFQDIREYNLQYEVEKTNFETKINNLQQEIQNKNFELDKAYELINKRKLELENRNREVFLTNI